MIPNVQLWLVAALVAVLACAGVGYKAYRLGQDGVRAEYAQRDLDAANTYAAKEREITEAYRQKEAKWAASSAQASKTYQREIDKNATTYLTLLATRPVLRDPGAHCEAGSGDAPGTASNTGASDTGDIILSERTSNFLFAQAARADTTRAKLNSCIDLLESERQ